MGVVRQAIKLMESTGWTGAASTVFQANTVFDDVVDYFNRVNDRTQIRSSIKELYAYGIKAEADPARVDNSLDTDATYETYVRQGFKTQVDAGLVEAFSIGFGTKIVNALATLFTEETQKFSLSHETQEDVEAAEELLNQQRRDGGFWTGIVRADKLSIQCGSSALLLSYANDSVTYQHIAPQHIRAFHGQTIEDNGVIRSADLSDIEDASIVLIRLGQIDLTTWSYLAIFGRSEEYPKGRYVQYEGGETVDIPDPYGAGTIEYEINGEMCNPLSYWAADHPDEAWPEYPLAILYSGLTDDNNDAFPTSTSLYTTCLEFSRAASHTLSKSQEAASGTLVVERGVEAQGMPLPRNLTGAVSLNAGQSITHVPHDSGACESSYKVLKQMMVDVAASFSVPDYIVSSEDHTVDASSGIALQVKARPLIKFRDFRATENDASVRKIFDMEKALIGLFSIAQESDISMLLECEQTWDAGELRLPQNKKEEADRVIALLDKGIYDTIAAIREMHQLASDEEAIAMYERMQERATDYPSLAAPEKKKVGLLRGNNVVSGRKEKNS